MDNFFEKLTLYDIVGYLLPGTLCVVIGIWEYIAEAHVNGILEAYALYIFLGILAMGYLAGILISEMGYIIYRLSENRKIVSAGIGYDKIGYPVIKKALVKAHVIGEQTDINTHEDVNKYMGYMFSEIQIKEEYRRLHNYASMQLICQNMSVAVLISICISVCRNGWSNYVFWGVFVIFLFWRRWRFFYQRKNFYVVTWFIQEHIS